MSTGMTARQLIRAVPSGLLLLLSGCATFGTLTHSEEDADERPTLSGESPESFETRELVSRMFECPAQRLQVIEEFDGRRVSGCGREAACRFGSGLPDAAIRCEETFA